MEMNGSSPLSSEVMLHLMNQKYEIANDALKTEFIELCHFLSYC